MAKISRNFIGIGMNYPESDYELSGCELDTDAILSRAAGNGFRTKAFKGVFTANDFISEIVRLRETALKSYCTVIQYSGHGTQYYDWNERAQEPDKMTEALCFWDGEEIQLFPDDDFKALVESIPGIVFVILDSCFPAGMSRDVRQPTSGKSKSVVYDPSCMSIVRLERRPKAKAPNKTYYLFAAQEDEVSYDTGAGGVFTIEFCRAFDSLSIPKRTVDNVMRIAAIGCGDDQHPTFECIRGNKTKRIF